MSCALAIACSDPAPRSTHDPGPNLLVVTIDTMRADRLGCYGYEPAETPNLDALAERGVLFENATSPVPITLPSHSSIFTGLYPTRHNVRENGTFTLDASETTLAERLAEQGYATGAFIASFTLDSRFGLDQGFDVYDDDVSMGREPPARVGVWQGHERPFVERPAAAVIESAHAWLSEHRDERFFAWVHLFDPHGPYEAPEPFRSRPGHPYDAEVAYVDHSLGTLFSALEAWGLAQETLVVVAADHGESLGEHSITGHGKLLFEPSLRVPLILSQPGALPTGIRVSPLVRNIDILPTILELLGMPAAEGIQGESLVRFIHGESVAPVRDAYSETLLPELRLGRPEVRAYLSDGWKYIRYSRRGEVVREELFDLGSDPGERRNQARRDPARLEQMAQQLETFLAEEELQRVEKDNASPLTPEVEEKLRMLGYIE